MYTYISARGDFGGSNLFQIYIDPMEEGGDMYIFTLNFFFLLINNNGNYNFSSNNKI